MLEASKKWRMFFSNVFFFSVVVVCISLSSPNTHTEHTQKQSEKKRKKILFIIKRWYFGTIFYSSCCVCEKNTQFEIFVLIFCLLSLCKRSCYLNCIFLHNSSGVVENYFLCVYYSQLESVLFATDAVATEENSKINSDFFFFATVLLESDCWSRRECKNRY